MKKVFPWVQDYFTARILLGFSEDEFWRSTPRKVWALKLFRDKALGGSVAQKSPRVQADEIKSLLGLG